MAVFSVCSITCRPHGLGGGGLSMLFLVMMIVWRRPRRPAHAFSGDHKAFMFHVVQRLSGDDVVTAAGAGKHVMSNTTGLLTNRRIHISDSIPGDRVKSRRAYEKCHLGSRT